MKERSIPNLSKNPHYFLLFLLVQFCGAVNDNIFKIGLSTLLTYSAIKHGFSDHYSASLIISLLFILPFLLFSAIAGQCADRFSKISLIRVIKSAEIFIMLSAGVGYYFKNVFTLYTCIFLMGLHSAFFGPVKYALLPDLLKPKKLLSGNSFIEATTFVAILLGTILGATLAMVSEYFILIIGVMLAVIGRVTTQLIPINRAAEPNLKISINPISATWQNMILGCTDRSVFICILGISWLWFVGTVYLSSLFSYVRFILSADQSVVAFLLGIFSIGIALGSIVTGKVCRYLTSFAMVIAGGVGMTIFSIDFAYASHVFKNSEHLINLKEFITAAKYGRIVFDLFLVSVCGGMFSVPLYMALVSRSKKTVRARMVSSNNIINSLFMVAASLLGLLIASIQMPMLTIFYCVAVINIPIIIYLVCVDKHFKQALVIVYKRNFKQK